VKVDFSGHYFNQFIKLNHGENMAEIQLNARVISKVELSAIKCKSDFQG